jgi:hypothetical protein
MDHDRRTPLDLPQLRLWLGYLIKNYDALASSGQIGYRPQEIEHYRAGLVSVARACEGQFDRPLKPRIRELLALGVAGYGVAGGVPAGVPFSAEMIVDFAACALWPLASSPGLPRDWLDAFIAITVCPRMATPVVRARYRRRIEEPMSVPEFRQALTEVNFAWGVRNLLRDLSDPRRGGGALAGMAIACTRYAPRRGATQQRVAKWALLSALGGMTGGVGGHPTGDVLTSVNDWVGHCVRNPHAFMTKPDGPLDQPAAAPADQLVAGPQPRPAPDDQPWPATLTASPAGRPVIFEGAGGR